jgi:hypothetical protein
LILLGSGCPCVVVGDVRVLTSIRLMTTSNWSTIF